MNNPIPDQSDTSDDMRPEYDFSGGVRGKHFDAYRRGFKVFVHKRDGTTEERDFTLPQGVIVLDPDVRLYFPDADAVNAALRGLIRLIPHEGSPTAVR